MIYNLHHFFQTTRPMESPQLWRFHKKSDELVFGNKPDR